MERRRPGQRRTLGPYRRYELLTGETVYPVHASYYDGYGEVGGSTDMEDYISEEMQLDWADNRRELLAFWASGKDTLEWFPVSECKPWLLVWGKPGTWPWAAVIFDHTDGDDGEPQRDRRAAALDGLAH